jgi:hypothetical protein
MPLLNAFFGLNYTSQEYFMPSNVSIITYHIEMNLLRVGLNARSF